MHEKLWTAFSIAVLLCLPACRTADRPASGGSPTESGVGVRVLWAADHARRFANDAYGQDLRHMGVIVWYPSSPDPARPIGPTTAGGILAMLEDAAPEQARDFAVQARLYTLASIRTYAIDPAVGAAARAATRPEHELLASVGRAVAGARPAPGRHPVVVYHPGLGGNPLENTALCESLAARGHVVITSTFLHQEVWQDRFFCGQTDTSLGDVAFLLNEVAAQIPFADTGRVALIGHSFGAQVALIAACQPGNTIDAVVALDTTIDYKSVEQIESPLYRATSWNRVLQTVTSGAQNCRAGVLNVSGIMPDGSTPDYAIVRRLIDSRIRLATVGYDMDHESYLSQPRLALTLLGGPADEAGAIRNERDRRTYDALVGLVADFLDQELRGAPPTAAHPNADLAVTTRGPVHRPDAAEALAIYEREGPDAIKHLFRTLQAISPRATFSTNRILDELDARGAHAEAIDLIGFLLSFDSNATNWRLERLLGDAYMASGDTGRARTHYRRALAQCDDADAARQIRQLLD